jgi:serine phosphatase RsbU (regulator of sigma subunit)
MLYKNLSIFYKIVGISIIGFFIFGIFIFQKNVIIEQNSKDINKIQNKIYPSLRISEENLNKVKEISHIYKDVIATNEQEWIEDVYVIQKEILKNLKILNNLGIKDTTRIKVELDNYIKSTNTFINNFSETNLYTDQNQDLLEVSMSNYKQVEHTMKRLNNDIYDLLNDTLENTNNQLEKFLSSASVSFMVSFIIVFIVVTLLAYKISHDIKNVANSLHKMNTNETGFDIELTSNTNDEVGFLIKEFNNTILFLKNIYKNIENLNRQFKESVKVALYIQSSIIPNDISFIRCFDDFFIYYKPKDTISGDIYLIRELNKDEYVLLIIDCTGHGVSGALITILVKSIERELLGMQTGSMSISTSKILHLFNKRIKEILNQNTKDSMTLSDVGFDGGVLYINKKDKLGMYSGANSNIFISQSGNIKTLKTDRHSIGYKKSDVEYQFSEYYIDLSLEQTIYLTTDGFIDQLGGQKGFPFAKKKFIKLIEENHKKPLRKQKDIFEEEVNKYQSDYDQTDDRTVIALKFNGN